MTKGRSKELIEARDKRLFERYFYWTEVRRLRFDDAISRLSQEEFFLSEGRIMQIIREMIRQGVTVDGKSISPSMFTGFRVAPIGREKGEQHQLSLFP